MLHPLEMTEISVRALDAKKARNIKVLKTRDITVLADYFVICTASSATQIKTLANEVEKALKDRGEAPPRTEGYRSGGWVLVDFGCLVIHLFLEELREFYALERLWSDAEDLDIKEWITE
ncbi:MAG: ribosome silencing factor [Oscillospiraceae bacterium]|jgi:ribosome-associated protein|nr:ribosome silencing factor [Oscillospiraceae bacterium]